MRIGTREIGLEHPTYFIADVGANHDGDLEKAKYLIRLATKGGAEAVKFQHFRAPYIISDKGFKALGTGQSHQSKWKKSVYETYVDATLPWEWTPILAAYAHEQGIHFMSTPYDLEAVDHLEPYVDAYKIGSGDITWPEMIEKVGNKRKPFIMSCGATEGWLISPALTLANVFMASEDTKQNGLGLLQCNTNYEGKTDILDFINLNVITTLRNTVCAMWPHVVIGLSDHYSDVEAMLGAVALGARIIEKHITYNENNDGPDHHFALTPEEFRVMVNRTRRLERALGDGLKRVEPNEQETVIIQRRCVRAAQDLPAGTVLAREHMTLLRPAPEGTIPPYSMFTLAGRTLRVAVEKEDPILFEHLGA